MNLQAEVCGKLTVFFEDPFWISLFERQEERGYAVSRVVFGAEPKNTEIAQFCLESYRQLRWTEPTGEVPPGSTAKRNPKREQKEARGATEERGASTKAQEVMRIALEKNKKVRKQVSKAEREAKAQALYGQKQVQRKKKKRGH